MAPPDAYGRPDRDSPKGIGMSLNDGFLRLGVLPWIGSVVDHLNDCPKFPGHIKAHPRLGMSCNSMEDVMAAPHFLDYSKSLTPIVSKYFQEPAILWSLNAFYTDRNTPYFPRPAWAAQGQRRGQNCCALRSWIRHAARLRTVAHAR